MRDPRLLLLVLGLALLLPACSADSGAGSSPDVPPTGASIPSDEELLEATPGGTVFTSTETFEHQMDHSVPAFVRGEGRQFGIGVSKPIVGRPKNPDGGTPVNSWGVWHYFHLETAVAKEPGAKPTVTIPDREGMTKAAQQGEFENGKRVGTWRFWYPSGQLRAKGTFVDGAMHGEWQVWTASGELDTEHSGTYSEGEKSN